MIALQSWRTTGKNPCDDPPVKITIAPVEKGTQVYPWILPLERAIEMFGQEVVDQIGEEPVPIYLEMKWQYATVKVPESSAPHCSSET